MQEQGSSSNHNAAPSYFLTNLVDATTAFHIVDIHQYMVDSIRMILQPSGPSHSVHIFAPGCEQGDTMEQIVHDARREFKEPIFFEVVIIASWHI